MKRLVCILSIVLAAALPQPALASLVTLSPAGGSVYLLNGEGLPDISGLEITIIYDASSLLNPRVVPAGLFSGALMMANTTSPGSIRIAAVQPGAVQGSGPIATISFDGAAGPGGGVSGMQVSAISPAGQRNELPVVISTAGTTPRPQEAQDSGSTQPSPSAGMNEVTGLPTSVLVPLPVGGSAGAAEAAQQAAPVPDAPESSLETAEKEEQTKESGREERKEEAKEQGEGNGSRPVLTQQSVLERFREFPGPWTPEGTMQLFQQDPLLGCRQEPQVALADGKSTITLTVIVSPGAKGDPVFSLQGGTILRAVRDRDNTNTWVVRVRPDRNVIDALIRVDDGIVAREVPLTVAPRLNADLDGSGTVTEQDFLLHVRSRQGDGGKVGKKDFRDDYRFAANYLVAVGTNPVKRDRAGR